MDVVSVSQIGNWFYNDDLLGWVNVSTINDIQLSLDSDTLITQNCGSFKVVVAGDTSFYYISCPLGSQVLILMFNVLVIVQALLKG